MDTKIVNMVASARLTDTIDLHEVASTLDLHFEAEQFPGMVYRVGEDTHGAGAPKVCLLLFGSGRVVATGAKSYDNVNEISTAASFDQSISPNDASLI